MSSSNLDSAGLQTLRSLRMKSTGMGQKKRQKRSRDGGAVTSHPGQRSGSCDVFTGKPLLCLPCQALRESLYLQCELSMSSLPMCARS